MRRLGFILISLLIVTLTAGVGYWGYASGQPATPTPTPPQTASVTQCDVQQTITAPGSVVNVSTVEIEMPFAGRLAEVLVQAGEAVRAGQVLARIDDKASYETALAAAQLELAEAQQALAELNAQAPLKAAQAQLAVAEAEKALTQAQRSLATLLSPNQTHFQQQVARAQDDLDIALKNAGFTDLASAVRQARETLADAKSGLEEWQRLNAQYPGGYDEAVKQSQRHYEAALENFQNATLRYEQAQIQNANAIEDAQTKLDEAQKALAGAQAKPNTSQVALAEAQVAVKQAELAQAQAAWQVLQNGPDPLQVSAAQARVAKAQNTLAEAEQALEQLEITAPFAGVILDAKARAGESASAGGELFTLANPQALEVQANITEEEFPLVAAGQNAELFFDARADVTVTGTISRIVPQRIEGDRPRYQIYITLSEVPTGLAEGMTADAALIIAQRAGVLCLPRSVVRASTSNEVRLKVWANGAVETRTVTLGLRGDANVEILSGVQAGEQVVIQ